MCEPTILMVAMVAATAMSAYGMHQQGEAQKAQGKYQAAVARNNQILAERQATDALARGKEAERVKAIQGQQILGKQRAALAGNGVVVDQGSALDITTQQAGVNALDTLNVRANAEREALGYRTQGMNYGASADLATMRGDAAGRAGNWGAATALVGGAGSVAGKWYDFNKASIDVIPSSNAYKTQFDSYV